MVLSPFICLVLKETKEIEHKSPGDFVMVLCCLFSVSHPHIYLVLNDCSELVWKPSMIHPCPNATSCLSTNSVSEFIFWKYDSHKSLYKKLEAYFPLCLALDCIWNERNCFTAQGFTRQLPGLLGCSSVGDHLFPDCSKSLHFPKAVTLLHSSNPRRFLWNWLQKAEMGEGYRHIIHPHTFLSW